MSAILATLKAHAVRLAASYQYEKERGENHFTYNAGETTFVLQGKGLGDLMILRQFGRALQDWLRDNPDPELGRVVITTGAFAPAFNPDDGDHHVYWWWSFGPYDDAPGQYLPNYLSSTAVEPDVILSPSERTETEASQMGFETARVPLGTYAFEPVGSDRSGLGFAGSVGHKRSEKEEQVVGPFADDGAFEQVSHFRFPEELNLWYNTKLATFGLHKEGQRQWGMVNNRVFETLASGTPFVLESHPTVEDVLGFDYPYQTASREETVDLVERIRDDRESVLAEFAEFSERVRRDHGYGDRVERIVDAVQ